MDEPMDKRKTILKKKSFSFEDEREVEDIEQNISNEIAEKEFDKLQKVLGTLDNNSEGTNYTNVWKELRKSYPKNSKPLPTGVQNVKGKVITNPKEKKVVTLDHFQHRMMKREVIYKAKDIELLNNELLEKRLLQT